MCGRCNGLERRGSASEPNKSEVDAFAGRLLGVYNDAALALMISLGHRTGLFDTMAAAEETTSLAIAENAGLSERYVREWLGAMVTGGIVRYNAELETYELPAAHAAALTRAASPNNMASVAQWISLLGAVEDRVLQAFRDGRGVPYDAYGRFHEVMAEESGQTVVAALDGHILPLAPEIVSRLEHGIDVLDVGCGRGMALLHLARRFPRSRFTGVDFSNEAIGWARNEARRQGLENVSFEPRDASELDAADSFDLITAFDAIHDQPRPARVLQNIRRALRPGGLFLMQDIKARTPVEANIGHPLGTFIYTVSCMHCMSVSLAGGGAGLGAAWGRELALDMLAAAGFGEVDVKELEHDPMNYYYLVRKATRQPGAIAA